MRDTSSRETPQIGVKSRQIMPKCAPEACGTPQVAKLHKLESKAGKSCQNVHLRHAGHLRSRNSTNWSQKQAKSCQNVHLRHAGYCSISKLHKLESKSG